MKLKLGESLSYGGLALSLGFIGLPLYVYLPKYYSETFGISLVALSFLLFASRIIDTVQDPLIGWASDRLVKKGFSRIKIISFCLPLLVLGFLGLLFPPDLGSRYLWIGFFLIATYTFYSFISINYYTTATEITEDYNEQTKLVSAREGLALIGIAAGSIIPSTLQNNYSTDTTHWVTWGAYVLLSILGLYLLRFKSPNARHQKTSTENIIDALKVVIKNPGYLYLASIFLLSTTAAALPATVVLFYIKDVLDGEAYFGLFLLVYFLCALGGLPLWYKISKHKGKRFTWMIAMVLTIIGFIWATFLSPGDFIAYGLICILTGMCLGADLSMPASMLSDLITHSPNKAKYFGIWGMIGKSSIAIAGSLGLFVLGVLGYEPGSTNADSTRFYVAITYALIPCVIKLFSFILLYKSKIDINFKGPK